tara:strand:+ start:371 stop:1432 length:1062 start_codon:yes stop_codon:yes gene_type:complete
MSSNTYTLKIDIDDSKIRELEKRLMAVMGGKTAGLSGLAGAAEGKGDKSVLINNIKKLGIIALGVGSLVALVQKIGGMMVDSSPMLKGMLKLLNYSVMLILRPIGEFFGFFLRPIVIYFLRSVALPFYRQWLPIARSLGTFLGVGIASRQSEIDSVGGKAFWEEGFTHEDGMKNLEKTLLQWGSLFSIFEEGEFQYQSTKDAIASLKGAFTAINGITFPTIDLSGIQTKIDSTLTGITSVFSLTGIQTKIDTTISAITDFDFSKIFTELETKFKKIFDDLWNLITSILPWVNAEESTSTQTTQTTQINNPHWTDSMNQAVNNQNNNQAEEDPITAGWNWIVGGINEQIKGWTG